MSDIKRYMVFSVGFEPCGGMDDLSFSSDDLEEAIKFYKETFTAAHIFDRIEGKIIEIVQTGTPMPPRPVKPEDYQHKEEPWIGKAPSVLDKKLAHDIDRRMKEIIEKYGSHIPEENKKLILDYFKNRQQ